eukprot:TRINITY_DN76477_c0_g1_i1.p1 TRINITY_DN76477_c0_g1~~TRINITY_DN76477_c0_g1_i1.p1  ORF type:complete len:501 (-),score=119.11 TRINITY_DN76477_c0_g1_i1:162-1664(-)
MQRLILTAVAAAAAANPDFASQESCQGFADGTCLDSNAEILEEVNALRTELLQTGLEVTKGKATKLSTSDGSPVLDALKMETLGAESAKQEDTKRQLDAVAAQAKSQAALSKQESKSKAHDSGDSKMLREAFIPVGALLAGGLLLLAQQTIPGILSMYFGAQAGFSLFMKVVLSDTVISKELGIQGIPAGFLVTAIQQVVAFLVLAVMVGVLYCTKWHYEIRRLKSTKEALCILLFSFAFALNIGLNNFSLSLLAVSLNMIIRSCLPLVALILQQTLGPCIPGIAKNVRALEVVLMVFGVIFAGTATVASSHGSHHSSESKNLFVGVIMCGFSDVAAALNLILAEMFKSTLDPPLNPLDTIFYMAVPCALFLLPASFLVAHPVEWPGFSEMTDWQVFQKVLELSPSTMGWVILSGFIAAGYNVLQYTVVQKLSAGHAAFAGNFNKAATIMISICMGLEALPGGVWSTVMLGSILGNIGSFTGYTLMKENDKDKGKAASKH